MSPGSAVPLRVGVIGVGHLGSHHARILNDSFGWNLVGVFDTDADRNADTSHRYKLKTFHSRDALLDEVEAVTICTPTASHFDIAVAAVQRGVHVFVEKPICSTDDEANRLVDLVSKAGVTHAAGHIERFNPAVNAVRDRIGVPRFIEAHRLNQFSPRGLATDVVLELMIHDIDLVRWLVGSEPVEIRAAGVPVLSTTDDIANCRLAFADGCIANLTASRISANPMRKLRVFSKDHYTSIDLSAKSVESYKLFAGDSGVVEPGYRVLAQSEGKKIARWSAPLEPYDALEAELENFRQAITGESSARVDLVEAARSLKVALAVAQACREQAQIANVIPIQPEPVSDR
ncbi:MAG: Gfo/Idh/MocA family oxidoreductase [Candidatus Zixiibacteriota bacterium]